MDPKHVTFLIETFEEREQARHLLDRFLIGYPLDGEFKTSGWTVSVLAPPDLPAEQMAALKKREREHRLRIVSEPGPGSVIIALKGNGAGANDRLVASSLERSKPGSKIFVAGNLAESAATAAGFQKEAAEKNTPLFAGGLAAVTHRLPPVEIPAVKRITEGLVVVQGAFPEAEFDGLQGLLPAIGRRNGQISEVESVRLVEGAAVWDSAGRNGWPPALLAAAISRSNNIKGDPEKDGRTQNIAGLGMIEKLAKNPRAWLLQHARGLRTTIMSLDGALSDYNFAVRTFAGDIYSTQIFRPEAPAQEGYSLFADAISNFLETGKPFGDQSRPLAVAAALEKMRAIRAGHAKEAAV